MMVARIWAKHGLEPHRIERYMASNDPDFEAKAADVIGLYLNPPAHAAAFDTAAGRQLNRRVEIVVSDDSGKIAPR